MTGIRLGLHFYSHERPIMRIHHGERTCFPIDYVNWMRVGRTSHLYADGIGTKRVENWQRLTTSRKGGTDPSLKNSAVGAEAGERQGGEA